MQTFFRDKAGTVVFERPLPFFRMQDNQRIQFRGDDLIAYKTTGLPKKGRKRR